MHPLAPEDVEMEDLNYYYANYSRRVPLWLQFIKLLHVLHPAESIMM